MKRSALRARSVKRQALMVQRRHFVKDLMEERNYQCEAELPVCTGRAVDVHEKLRRSQGGSIVGGNPEDYMILCRACHDWVTTHPKEAFKLGFAKHSWEAE